MPESKHPHAARMERYGRYPLHSDKRQNNLPSKRYRTAFADLLQQGTAGITYRPKKTHFFPKLTKNISSISVVVRLCKPLEENTTRSVAQVWRFSFKPVGLGLERTEYGAYLC